MYKPKFSGTELFTTGIGLLGIGLTLITLEKFPFFLLEFEESLRKGGIVAIMLAAILIIGALLKWVGKIFHNLRLHLSATALLEPFLDFEDSYALPSDVEQICTLGNAVIGSNHVTENQLLSRLQKCPHIIKKLTPISNNHNLIKGYYIVYPLTSQGAKRIDTRKIVSGKSLENSDITTNFKNAKAVYISMIFGNDLMSKAATILHLKNDLKHLREINLGVRKFYAKPSTSDGLRLLRKYGFSPIDMEAGVWVRKL